MSDVKIMFSAGNRIIGQIQSSLENFDAAKHNIPKRILNKIRNTAESVEISFTIEHGENNHIGGNEE